MRQANELERQILSALIVKPELIENEGLTVKAFAGPKHKAIFKTLAEFREDGKPDPIDELLLAERSGVSLAELMELEAGAIVPTSEKFAEWTRRLILERLSERALTLSQAELDAFVKTGEIDPDKRGELRQLFREIDELEGPDAGPAFRRLDAIEGREIRWLWRGWIPLGMLSLCVGDPGTGKSCLVTWLASHLSVGAPLPGDPGPALAGSTIYLSAEDSPAYALRPRAERNGADLSRIIVLDDSTFDISADLKKIRAIVKQEPGVRLLIIDPLNSYLGRTDYIKDPDVRAMLNPLVEFCEESGVAALAVMHLNKKTDLAGIYRIGGSIAFAGVARSIFAVTADAEEPERRILRPIKMNYARKPDALAFRIGEDLALTFDEGTVEIGADAPLTPPSGREAADGSYAAEWLAEHLSAGPLNLRDILISASESGISKRAIYRAKDKLKLRSRCSGFGRGRETTWELPE